MVKEEFEGVGEGVVKGEEGSHAAKIGDGNGEVCPSIGLTGKGLTEGVPLDEAKIMKEGAFDGAEVSEDGVAEGSVSGRGDGEDADVEAKEVKGVVREEEEEVREDRGRRGDKVKDRGRGAGGAVGGREFMDLDADMLTERVEGVTVGEKVGRERRDNGREERGLVEEGGEEKVELVK